MLAQTLENQGKIEEAWKEYEIASACDPTYTLPLFSLANSKSKAGYHEEALEVVERIPAGETGERSFLHGLCLLRAAKFQAAILHLMDAFNKCHEPGVSSGLLAHTYENLKSVDPEWLKKSRKWQKLALHHGLTVEQALFSL